LATAIFRDPTPITNGAAEGDPATGQSFSYADVLAALSAGKVPDDTNFDALPTSGSISGFNGNSTIDYSDVLLFPAQEKALDLGGLAANATEVDGFVGFAKDINPNLLVGVALHELTHAIGRAPSGLPSDDIPDIFDLFRFDTANDTRPVVGDFSNSPPAYFSVNGACSILRLLRL
jgi:serralysin